MATAATSSQPGSMSPSSSPRLPSPPPFPELQMAPKSPLEDEVPQLPVPSRNQVSRRIRPGTTAAEMAKGPPLVPLSELNSPFQLQEYLKALHHKETHDASGNTRALDREAALRLATPPDGVERSLWLYELCRLLLQRVNYLIVGFFEDNPRCSAQHCPEMRASEWQYLCAVHDPPKSCCAIDYCCHTLDWATNIITSQKHFPSRLTLGGDGGASQQGIRQLTNIFRRVYRMFAHAWFQHREVFWNVEMQEGLYVFYKTVCDYYSLMPADTYTVPPEAEGAVGAQQEEEREEQQQQQQQPVPSQAEEAKSQELPLRPKASNRDTVIDLAESEPVPTSVSTAATTKRHKHTPSTGSFVPTITEGDEEVEDSTQSESPLDTSEMLNTVRYDPKDLQPVAPPQEAINNAATPDAAAEEPPTAADEANEATREAKETARSTSPEANEPSPSISQSGETAMQAVYNNNNSNNDGMKSPITPIEDEPAGEVESTLQSKDMPGEAKELTGGPDADKVSQLPEEQQQQHQGAIADSGDGEQLEVKEDANAVT